MEGLKTIKNRIATVESIMKATNAMKMVSTVKLSRMNNINKFAEECADKLSSMLSLLMGNLLFEQQLGENHWLIPKSSGKTLLLVLSTDQGFCGGFNQSVVEEYKKCIQRKSKTIVKIFGEKVAFISPKDVVSIPNRLDIPQFANVMCDIIISHLKTNQISKIIVISGYVKNVLVQKARALQIFPLKTSDKLEYVKVDGDEKDMLNALFEAYINKLCTAIITKHTVAELSARTMAMDNSSKNANDMHQSLNVMYNRIRQAKITQELTEIISSMECINDY